MALGATPTLLEIQAELTSTNNDLQSFISEAGQTGVWDRQSDFANYEGVVFNCTNDYFSFNEFGGEEGFTVESTPHGWSATSKPNFIELGTNSGNSGSTFVSVFCQYNDEGVRSGEIVLVQNVTGFEIIINIEQNGY